MLVAEEGPSSGPKDFPLESPPTPPTIGAEGQGKIRTDFSITLSSPVLGLQEYTCRLPTL